MGKSLIIVLIGVGCIALGVYEYYDLMALETQGGTRRVHTLIKLLYEIGGKNAVLGGLGGLGVVILFFAGVTLRKQRARTASAN